MAVFRVQKTQNYTIMSNHHLRNKALSLKAKGLLSLMLSLPEDWDYTTRGLASICKEGVDRNKVVQYVENHGVQTRMLFAGNLTKHPCFDQMRATGEGYRIVGELTNTDRIMNDTFWVGVYPGMTDEMIDYMAKTIKEAVDQ